MSSELTSIGVIFNSKVTLSSNSSGVMSVTFDVPEYNTSTSYEVGDYCWYSNSSNIYVCIADTSGTFDSDCWEQRA